MGLREKLNGDLKDALKSGQSEKANALRFVMAQLHNREIEKRSTGQAPSLSEEEAIEVLQREVKKRKEAIELFQKGGRAELAEKENRELAFIGAYLPEPMSRGEIEAVIQKLKDGGLADFNSLMKEAMKELKGRADGKLVGEVVREKIGKQERA